MSSDAEIIQAHVETIKIIINKVSSLKAKLASAREIIQDAKDDHECICDTPCDYPCDYCKADKWLKENSL